MMSVCLIVPVYNQAQALLKFLPQLKAQNLACILINDGSCAADSQLIAAYQSLNQDWLSLINHPANAGKGAAVVTGFKLAIERGFSHAIQIDADGQHNSNDISRFIALTQLEPAAMILGRPIYQTDAPKARRYGRQFTNLWIWINTLSFAIKDGMCGFRLYPLAAIDKLLGSGTAISSGMGFDIDIVVRLYWQGCQAINLDTQVNYPADGVSHFKMLSDNWLISTLHAQLCLGMLLRIWPLLKRHWL